MDPNYIDEMALLKAFIDHGTLSYKDVQDKGIVPVLDKQERRILFKNTIDKFKTWELIEALPESNPRAWKVIPAKATAEYNKLVKDIEQKQIVEKYSFAHLQEEVAHNTKKLKWSGLYKILAIAGFVIGTFHFFTGLTLWQLVLALKDIIHKLIS